MKKQIYNPPLVVGKKYLRRPTQTAADQIVKYVTIVRHDGMSYRDQDGVSYTGLHQQHPSYNLVAIGTLGEALYES